MLSVKDEFYHRHIVQYDLLAPAFVLFRANASVGDDLLSSAILEVSSPQARFSRLFPARARATIDSRRPTKCPPSRRLAPRPHPPEDVRFHLRAEHQIAHRLHRLETLIQVRRSQRGRSEPGGHRQPPRGHVQTAPEGVRGQQRVGAGRRVVSRRRRSRHPERTPRRPAGQRKGEVRPEREGAGRSGENDSRPPEVSSPVSRNTNLTEDLASLAPSLLRAGCSRSANFARRTRRSPTSTRATAGRTRRCSSKSRQLRRTATRRRSWKTSRASISEEREGGDAAPEGSERSGAGSGRGRRPQNHRESRAPNLVSGTRAETTLHTPMVRLILS